MPAVTASLQCPRCFSAGAPLGFGFWIHLKDGRYAQIRCEKCGNRTPEFALAFFEPAEIWPIKWDSRGRLLSELCGPQTASEVIASATRGPFTGSASMKDNFIREETEAEKLLIYLENSKIRAETLGHDIPTVALLGPRQFEVFQDAAGRFGLLGLERFAGLEIREGSTPGVIFRSEDPDELLAGRYYDMLGRLVRTELRMNLHLEGGLND